MKQGKAILTWMVAAVASLSCAHISAFAASEDIVAQQGACQGDPGYGISNIPLEQQLSDALADPSLTDAQKDAVTQKFQEAIALRDGTAAILQTYANTRGYSDVRRLVPAYKQETDYYCGPATTRQVFGYFGLAIPGSYTPPSQSLIAQREHTTKSSGTEWYHIVNYIKTVDFMGKKYVYAEYVPTSQSNMESVVYTALTRVDPTPPILQIKTADEREDLEQAKKDRKILGYITGGHYLNVSGMKTENGVVQFELTDPFREWNKDDQGNTLSPKYYVNASHMYRFTRNHWAKHFLY